MDDDILEDRLDLINDRIEHAFRRIERTEERLDEHTDDTEKEETKQVETKRHRHNFTLSFVVALFVLIEVVQWFFTHHG
jgi:hypothetical protein